MTQPRPERIGRYRIVSEIGRGAMGVVYLAQDEALGRSVAVKTILASMDAGEHAGYIARFRQEAKALGGLNHPGIITVYEFGDEGGLAYLAMEYLEGRELRDVMASQRMDLSAAVDIGAQVAESLAFAHAHGVVHRDVKPANIMVLSGNRAKVMDFGIARVRASDVHTQTGLLLGSPKYMAPEQVLGRGVDTRADIFSLGVVLYEMLAGAPPFGGSDIHQLMFQVCNTRPASPSHLNPAVPAVLDLIVAKALEKEPDARYQDAAGLASDLRDCLTALQQGTQQAGAPMPPRAESTLAEHAPWLVADGTQAAATSATMSVPRVGLHVSRRFESRSAIERLAAARGHDRQAMSPEGASSGGFSRLLLNRSLMAASGALVVAVVLAVAIVTMGRA